jgi:hypothetical protein
MALADPTNGRIARHLAGGRQVQCHHRYPTAHAAGRHGRLDAGMPRAHHHDVERPRHFPMQKPAKTWSRTSSDDTRPTTSSRAVMAWRTSSAAISRTATSADRSSSAARRSPAAWRGLTATPAMPPVTLPMKTPDPLDHGLEALAGVGGDSKTLVRPRSEIGLAGDGHHSVPHLLGRVVPESSAGSNHRTMSAPSPARRARRIPSSSILPAPVRIPAVST